METSKFALGISKNVRENESLTRHILNLLGSGEILRIDDSHPNYDSDPNITEYWILNNVDLNLLQTQGEKICLELFRLCKSVNFRFQASINIGDDFDLDFGSNYTLDKSKIIQSVSLTYIKKIEDEDMQVDYKFRAERDPNILPSSTIKI